MPTFAVRFKGMLTKDERERLATAGLEIAGSESSKVAGAIVTGRPIYTVAVEAPAADEALRGSARRSNLTRRTSRTGRWSRPEAQSSRAAVGLPRLPGT